MLRRVLILLAPLLLAACFTSGKRGGDSALAVYDLGPAAVRNETVRRQVPMAVEVRAPLWFDSLGIDYRLAYAEPARLREYSRARWAGPPAQLIQLRLSRDLGLITAGQGKAVCVLRVDIDEFSQVFEAPQSSRAVLRGRVQWLGSGREQLKEYTIDLTQAAATPDAQGGVAGLAALVGRLSSAITAWEAESAAGALRRCLN